jgi:hypothetical protein
VVVISAVIGDAVQPIRQIVRYCGQRRSFFGPRRLRRLRVDRGNSR